MKNPLFSRLYAWQSTKRMAEEGPFRHDLLEGLSGQVLEVGCGHGINFGLYPPEVTSVLAIEPDAYLFRSACLAAESVLTPITVFRGGFDQVQLDGDFDAVVFSLVLCSMPEPEQVLDKTRELLKPDGQLRFFEHVTADNPELLIRQHKAARYWPMLNGGCRPDQNTMSMIMARYHISWSRDGWLPPHQGRLFEVTAPHVVGYARPL